MPQTPMARTGSTLVGPPVRRIARWWFAGGVFVVGLLVGVVIAGLLIRSTPAALTTDGAADPSGVATSEASSDGTATSSGGASVEIIVNEECLRAINEAEDAYNTIDRIASAIGEFDLATLDGIIRELQPLQAALRADVTACQVKTRLPGGAVVESTLPELTSSEAVPEVIVTDSAGGSTTSTSDTISTSAVQTTSTSAAQTTG